MAVNTVNMFGGSPDAAAAQLQIQRAQRLADALQQQALQPIDMPSPNAPMSWTQGAAKLAESFAARRQNKKLKGLETDAAAKQQAQFDRMFPSQSSAPAQQLGQALSPQQSQGVPSLTGNPESDRMIAMQIGLPAYMQEVAKKATDPEGFGQLETVMGPDGKMQLVQAGNRGTIRNVPGYRPNPLNQYGKVNPGDYTPASVAKYYQSGDFKDLVRVWAPTVTNVGSVPTSVGREIDAQNPAGAPTQKPLSTLATESGAKADIAGAEQAAKEAATTAAVLPRDTAKAAADRAATQRSNSVALGVYSTAMEGLKNSLNETTTGPVSGRIPAVTAAQQTAEGAIADMAPVLKQLFRQAGEGTFTEGDQKLLMDMLPTRKDHPEARVAKIAMIDALVKQKLSVPEVTLPPTPEGVPSTNDHPPDIQAIMDRYKTQ